MEEQNPMDSPKLQIKNKNELSTMQLAASESIKSDKPETMQNEPISLLATLTPTTQQIVTPDDMQRLNKKRKPGRPPKKKIGSINIETNGIVGTPIEPDNLIEMVYENPKLFKRLLTLLKGYSVEVITWNFMPDRIEIATRGLAEGKTKIFIDIHARMLVRYFCAKSTTVTMKREDLDPVFQNVDKNNTQITIIAKEDDIKSKIYFITKNAEIDAEKNYEIQLVGRSEKDMVDKPNDAIYPVKFCMPGKEFKSLIQDVSKESKLITIRKDGGTEPLTIGCEITTKNNLNMVFRNPEKIELKSELDPADIFNVSTRIQYIRPFSNSNIGDKIYISADKTQPIIFATDIDKKKYINSKGEIVEGPVCQVRIYSDTFIAE